jgi:hypothetical protein
VLALDLVTVGGLYVEVGIANIGQGAALDVDVDLAFVARMATRSVTAGPGRSSGRASGSYSRRLMWVSNSVPTSKCGRPSIRASR